MLSSQVIRFIIVGLINTIVGYSLYALFIFIGLRYTYALGLATTMGVFFNFQTIGKVVFDSHNNSLILRFISVYFFIFCLNLLLVRCGIKIGLSAYIAGAIAIFPSSAISFVLNKYFVFKR
jgi:putative flippase GtrA